MSNDIVTIIIVTLLSIIVAVLTIRDFILNKGANVAKVLSKLLDAATSDNFVKVSVPAAVYDAALAALAKGSAMTEEDFENVSYIVREIITANYNNADCQKLSLAIANTVVEFTPRSALKNAYAKNSEAITAIINTFVDISI